MRDLGGVAALLVFVAGCGAPVEGADASGTDAGPGVDAGLHDDAGFDDAGSLDAGWEDAGAEDAGPEDAGPDGGAAVPMDSGAVSDDASAGDDGGVAADGGSAADGGVAADAGLDAAAGGDAGLDAGTDAGADAGAPMCFATDLVIAAIDPGTVGGSIAIYNASGSAVDVDSSTYLLHEAPDSVQLRAIESGVVIPAGGLHRFTYPRVFSDGNASGEMALYRDTSLGSPSSLIDFVCWGDGHSPMFSVRPTAQADGDWSGGCTPSILGLEMRRITGTDGRSRASYDVEGLTPLFTCR